MTNPSSEQPAVPTREKREKLGLLAPATVVAFIALVVAGTLHVRGMILERHMITALEMKDRGAVLELARSFPAPVNARTKDGTTALLWAAEEGDNELAAALLARGVDTNARTAGYMTSDSFGKYVHDNGLTPLHLAARKGHIRIVELLVDHRAEVDAKAACGETPLYSAVSWGKKATAAFLLARGADPNARGEDGMAPLHLAARADRLDLAQLLLSKGADMNAVDKNDRTPLSMAPDGSGVSELLENLSAHRWSWQR